MVPKPKAPPPPANTPTRADSSVISQAQYAFAPQGYGTITSGALNRRRATTGRTTTTGGM